MCVCVWTARTKMQQVSGDWKLYMCADEFWFLCGCHIMENSTHIQTNASALQQTHHQNEQQQQTDSCNKPLPTTRLPVPPYTALPKFPRNFCVMFLNPNLAESGRWANTMPNSVATNILMWVMCLGNLFISKSWFKGHCQI